VKLFATIHTDEDVSRLVATWLRARGFDVKNAYEIVQRVAILLNALTADEIANQLLYQVRAIAYNYCLVRASSSRARRSHSNDN
jgi:DUF1009 family protein